jgi:hypothetical protein
MMDRGLDHLVYATPDLDASVEELAERLGTDPVPGGAHPGWGTRNALIGLGPGSYLEVIGPDPGQPRSDHPRPFLIDELTSARLVTWAYRHPDPESMRDTLELALRSAFGEQGALLGPLRAMSRTRPGRRHVALATERSHGSAGRGSRSLRDRLGCDAASVHGPTRRMSAARVGCRPPPRPPRRCGRSWTRFSRSWTRLLQSRTRFRPSRMSPKASSPSHPISRSCRHPSLEYVPVF